MKLQLVPGAGRHDVLDLPWDEPLEEWRTERLVVATRGIGRHVVRFVESGGVVLALKELPDRVAEREYRLLRALSQAGLRTVEPAGVATARESPAGEPLEGILLTRYLEFSLPYRLVFARKPLPALVSGLLDALVELIVQLHLAGYFWGDCSLSNTLFRRDAGALAAYLVDSETGEMHEQLSDGQRRHDVTIAGDNIIGELLDVEAEIGQELGGDPFALAGELSERYDSLWEELTSEDALAPADAARIDDRLRRLNELGYDVDEILVTEAGDGKFRVRVRPRVADPGHHRRRLLRLTGLDAQENQARRLLEDIERHRAELERLGRPPISDAALAGSWVTEVFEPTIAAVPGELWTKRPAAELYHELLEHRWYLSERAGREVPLSEAVTSYIDNVLRTLPDERAVALDSED